jgi:hypothetical protein
MKIASSGGGSEPSKKKRAGVNTGDYKLPTKPRKPESRWSQYAYLLFGEKKIGKTTLAANLPGALVIQFDKPQLALEIIEEVPRKWAEFLTILKALEKAGSKLPYPAIVVDGCEEWFAMCQSYVCTMMGVDHPSDAKWGKGFSEVKSEFRDAVNRVLRLPCGHFFICHQKTVTIEDRNGVEIQRIVPALGTAAEEILNGKVDGWFYYHYDGSSRHLRVRGSSEIGAGHRIKGHFLTKTGEPLRDIPMGKSSDEAFKNFIAGFENRLEFASGKEARKANKAKKGGLDE